MIEFIKIEDNRIYYKNNTDKNYSVTIEVYDNYTRGFMFFNELELNAGGQYFTYIPYIWNICEIFIYDNSNNELLFNYKIRGTKKLNLYDDYGYLLRLFDIYKNKKIQESLNHVIGEHFYRREYSDFVDVEEGDVIFDIGFNYGIFSLSVVDKSSKIYGFEPNIEIYNKVKDIYPEQDKVKLFNFAVSDENKKVIFYSTEDTVCSTITEKLDNSKQYEVQCINIYDFILENNIEKIDFLKIDCEGEEYKIFESIPDDFFLKIRKIILEFHWNDGEKIFIITDKLNRLDFDWVFSNGVNYESSGGLIFAKKN